MLSNLKKVLDLRDNVYRRAISLSVILFILSSEHVSLLLIRSLF